MNVQTVYTVTVVDLYTDPVLGIRRTPVIYSRFDDAAFTVRNNVGDIAENASFQYAVIEESYLNVVRPQMDSKLKRWWFKYNSATEEFEPCVVPRQLLHQNGFGIG